MLHLGKVSVETALFFETPEEIYTRIFRALKPRSEVPLVSVQFRKYANANSRIRLSEGRLRVSVSDLLQAAPAPVQEALASILLAKLFSLPPEESTLELYRRYLARAEVRRSLQKAKQERGWKAISPPRGVTHDLTVLFDRLNAQYFNCEIQPLTLGWSLKASLTTLGHYDPAHHAIVISRLLDTAEAPSLIVEYVLYHEMLHIQHPAEEKRLRRTVHTPQFKRAEKHFVQYAEARQALRTFLSRMRS